MRNFRYQSWASVSAAIALAASCPSFAQTITGSINGNVTDASGAVVANATVTATNVATGVSTKTRTNGTGDYNIRFLQIGQYSVTIEAPGFSTQKSGPITLEVDQAAKVDGKLATGAATQTVQVSSNLQPILNTDNSTVKSQFSAQTISNLPLNGRNFSSVTQFIPGAVATQPSQMSGVNATERDTNQGGQVSVNGNRNQTNNYLLDGIEINEPVSDVIGYNPSPDAIGNLTVITSNADAEYGNANGGDVIAVLKSGTNHVHGSLFGFVQNDNLNANSWANNLNGVARQPFTESVFGGTVGGPIIKNKLFFFADYEGIRSNTGGTETASVMTQAMRNGDFSALPYQLYHVVNGQQVAYANNQVPVTNPAALFLQQHPNLYPLPNKPAVQDSTGVNQNYVGSFKQFIQTDQGDVKIDYTLSPRDNIMARYSQSDSGDTNVNPLEITFPTNSQYPFKGVAINWVHTFSPSIVNEARGGFSRIRWIQGVPTDPTGAFGLQGNSLLGIGASQPYVGFAALAFNGGNTGSTNKPTTLGTTGGASNLIDNIFTYGDNLTIELGKQTIKAGVEIVRYQENNFYPGNEGVMGQFGYSGNFTAGGGLSAPGYSVADFVANEAYTTDVSQFVGRTGQRQYRDAGFLQDDYKVLPNLTLNLGVRYEWDQPIYEVNNKEANVDLNTGIVYLAGTKAAGQVFGDSQAMYHPVYNNVMPRIGFSWQPQQRIVFRGGYGITNFFEGTGANLRLNFNPPFQQAFDQTASTPAPVPGNPNGPFVTAGSPFTTQGGFGTTSSQVTTYRAWDSHLRPAFIQEFTFSNEIQLSNQTSISMAYLGQLGQHLVDPRAANQVRQGTTVAPYAALVGQTGQIVETQSEAVSKYNALQVQARHRQHNGLEYTVNYTWSHALTNNAGFFGVADQNGAGAYWQDAYNGHADYGNAGFDIRHNLSATGVYELPFGRGRRFGSNMNRLVDEAAGGWKLTGDAIVYSGLPVTINAPNNTNLQNKAERANQYRPLIVKNRSVGNWFGTDPTAQPCLTQGVTNGNCAYGAPGAGQFGTAAVNTERAPGYEQIDLAAGKAFTIVEGQSLEFRTDFFNAFNIASYDNPDNNIADQPGFGKITATRSNPRILQMSLHYSF